MLEYISITDIGLRRRCNEDFVYASDEPVGKLPNLFIVADGMGGHNAGDFASSYSVNAFIDNVKKSTRDLPINIIYDAVKATNTSLKEKALDKIELKGMGTTLVVATIYDYHMYVANVGDSRLYIIDDDIRQVTRDHSLVEEMVEKGKISRQEAYTHPNKNIITRAVGINTNVTPDIFEVNLKKNDLVLMCSDGLTNMLDDSKIKNIVVSNIDRLDLAAQSLVDQANEHGGKDNISIIIVKL